GTRDETDTGPAGRAPRSPSPERRMRWPRWRRIMLSGFRSLRLRVVVLTLVLSSLAVALLGVLLQRQILDGLLANKESAATAEIENAMATARDQLVGAETNPTKLRAQLTRLAQDIGNPVRVSDSG